jgi:osmotically inducible lipoprotein OsmB
LLKPQSVSSLQPGGEACVFTPLKSTSTGNSSMRKSSLVLLALAGVSLSACGYSTGDRAASGGLLGAGAGAAVGSLSGNAGAGALIGGAAGALGGAATSPNTVNLGRPAWR